MTNCLLVAVGHELLGGCDRDQLMAPYSLRRFKNEVVPLITDDSLLLIESLDYPMVRRTHPHYEVLRQHLGGTLGMKKPSFAGFDPRKQRSVEESDSLAERYDVWQRVVGSSVEIAQHTVPTTLEEAIVELRAEKVPYARLKVAPTSEQIDLARWVATKDRKFDRLYLEAMRKHERRFDYCVFIGGAVHAFSMAIKSDHRLVNLTPPEDAKDIYYNYLASNYMTRLFTAKGD